MKNKIVLYSLIMSLTSVSLPPTASAAGGSCTQKIVNKCREGGMAAGATDATASGASVHDGAATGYAAAGLGAIKMGEAAKQCKSSAEECSKCPQAEQESCRQAVGDAAGTLEQQSASMGDASAAMGAIAGLAGALLPMLMQKKSEEKENNDHALQSNGTIDCSKSDAYLYQDCNNILSASCRSAMSDPRCANFSNRYCGGAPVPANVPGAGKVAIGVPGEGRASGYCETVAAYNYCAPGGRDGCPSCLRLAQESSPACAENPVLCLGQTSAAELNKYRAQCPGDPVYQSPQFAGVGGGGTAPVVAPVGGGAPVGGVAPGVGGAPPGNPNLPPIAVMSRDAYRNNPGAASASATAKASASKERTAGGGAGTIFNAASVRGPASDVNGPFSPSVFATSSQVIRSRCAAGRLLNCP